MSDESDENLPQNVRNPMESGGSRESEREAGWLSEDGVLLAAFLSIALVIVLLLGLLVGGLGSIPTPDTGVFQDVQGVTCEEELEQQDVAVNRDGDVQAPQLNGGPRTHVAFDLDRTNKSVAATLLSMGSADHVLLVGDHRFDANPALCASDESVTLQGHQLQESGSITAVAVIGDVELYEERGMPVGEVGGDAVETAIHTQEFDFTETR